MRSRNRSRLLRVLVVVLAVVTAFVLLFDLLWRPMLIATAVSQAKILVTNTVTPVICSTVDRFEQQGGSLVTVTTDNNGRICALSLNAMAVDRLKSDFILEYQKNAKYALTFSTAVGTLSGLDYLNAVGPYMTFSAELSQYPDVELVSTFEQAGINQTIHRVLFRVNVYVCFLFPGGNQSDCVTTEYLISETVLLGDVPSAYALLGERGLSNPDQ